jgi:hypothetical protein
MMIIDTVEELAAVGGGRLGNGLECTLGFPSGFSCTGSAKAWGEVAFGAFDQLQSWGGDLGRTIYDWTHG